MATAVAPRGQTAYVQRGGSSGLYDVLDLILDKGLVVDIYVRVSLIGIEILTIDARIVIASVDTYLRFAEAVDRLSLKSDSQSSGLPEIMDNAAESGASSKTKGALEGAEEALFGEDEEEEESAEGARSEQS